MLNDPGSEYAEVLRRLYNDAVAVDTEDFGFAQAMRLHPQVAGLVDRGLSDMAGWLDKSGRIGR